MIAKRTYVGVGIVVGIVALAVLWSLFRPELVFVNATVNEAPPAAIASALPTAIATNDAAVQPTAALVANETATQPTAAVAAPEMTVQPTAAAMAESAPTAVPAQPVGWSASFQSLAHETSGVVNARVLEDGSYALRIENFKTSNGPDVRVYLVRGADGTQDEAIKRGGFIDLGALKGNIGDQNYAIPADIDLSEYQSVSIWCRRFSVNFGATMLDAGA